MLVMPVLLCCGGLLLGLLLGLLTSDLLRALLRIFLLLGDPLILRVLHVLIRSQVLHCVVCHNTDIIDESVVCRPTYNGIDLGCFSEMNLVDRTNRGHLRRVHFDEEIAELSLMRLLLDLGEIFTVVTCQHVPEVNHSVFPRSDEPVLSLL